ncbi:MAG: arylesterase [Bacteroidota bacterium]
MNNSLIIYFVIALFSFAFTACGGTSATQENEQATTANTETVNPKQTMTKNTKEKKRIIFFGDSLTAGYGLDEQDAYPSLIQQMLDSLGLAYQAVNAGLSGETTAGGVNRINWVAEQPMDIFVLELGGNDVLRGFDLAATKENLQAILDKVKSKYPDIQLVIAGMEAPPNMGPEYADEFRTIFRQLAADNDAALIPFLLADVGGIPELNLADRVHPNQAGHKIVAQTVWEVIEPLLD